MQMTKRKQRDNTEYACLIIILDLGKLDFNVIFIIKEHKENRHNSLIFISLYVPLQNTDELHYQDIFFLSCVCKSYF